MAAIRSGDIPRFLASGWKACRIVLLHGSDEGLVRETAQRLISLAAGDTPDPMNLIVLDGDQIAQDPARLADELGAYGMFGGTRVIHVRNAGRVPVPAAEAAFAAPLDGTYLVLEAGELKAGTSLRAQAEKSPAVAAIACYADTGQVVQRLIDEVLTHHGLTIARDARELLGHALGADRALSRAELEKLALYASGSATIDAAMVADIVSDAGRHDVSALIDQAFTGRINEIEAEANRFFLAGIHPSAILSQAISHVLVLRRALRGGDPRTIAKQARLHFSREPAFEKAVALWTEARLDRGLRLLAEAVLNGRRNARLAETVTVRALWATARLARSEAN